MKLTPTEWLFQQLWKMPKDKLNWYAALKQSKEMEKKNIKAALITMLIIISILLLIFFTLSYPHIVGMLCMGIVGFIFIFYVFKFVKQNLE